MSRSHQWVVGNLGEWTFYGVTNHGFIGELADKVLFGFATDVPEGTAAVDQKLGELYMSLDYAMVAAVAQKYTGPRGARGPGVGTAADWFMKMIGANQLQAAGSEGTKALGEALVSNGATADSWSVNRIENSLIQQGIVLAR